MKDLETAIKEELKRQSKPPADVTELLLDSRCKATSVKGLSEFTNLRVLSLSNTGITSLEGFPSFPKLTSLVLADNRISGGLQHLASADLKSLQKLDLSGNRIAKLDQLEPLKALKLRTLDLIGCPVKDQTPDFESKVFTMLDELEYLDNVDKHGNERDADEEEEDDEDYEGEGEEDAADAGGEGEFEEGEGEEEYEEEGEGEEYEEEAEEEDEDVEEDDEEEGGGGSAKKRKRAEDDNAGPDDEEEDEEDDE
uniref:U2A'/phosphoprotein 32 family A C-terminal domain-containing protein n=1 Tax=Chlamydomonas chlamydogama TaxID=225041 RepID=A0A7S2VV81_9CHLO|mmetsp:Transcript_672/g.1532  ORF Transcript_672/g.1532 Transcript_672/m.1532 type:complete len:253 (+) Transcript_672:244-1002(+)